MDFIQYTVYKAFSLPNLFYARSRALWLSHASKFAAPGDAAVS